MRKAILWLLIAAMALCGVAAAETIDLVQPAEATAEATEAPTEAPAAILTALNGMEAVRTANEVYMTIPSGAGEALVRVPLNGEAPVSMDRADSIGDLIAYGGGIIYLKTTNGASAVMSCSGSQVSTLYSFGAAQATNMTYYGNKLMVLLEGLLYSVEPDTALCLKLSGAQMLDYVVDSGVAYYLAGGDQMEYSAQLSDGETASALAGCVYRLDLNSGESTLLLKSGGEDLKLKDGKLYFHYLADAYAVRTSESATLKGRVYSLDTQLKTLENECAEPDSGFWPLNAGMVAWYNGALYLNGEAGEVLLYAPENGSTVASDGDYLYVWEPAKLALTEVRADGEVKVLYSGNLTEAPSVELTTPVPSVEPSATPTAGSDEGITPSTNWFENFMQNKDDGGSSNSSGSGSGSSSPQATPISYVTPTPAPTATATLSSSSGSGSSGSSSSSSSSSGSSSSSSGPAIYDTSISYLRITGSVNLRSEAKASSASKGVIPEGTVVKCAGKYAKYSNGSKWYKVEYNGKTGWIYAEYAEKTSSSSSDSSNDTPTGTTTKVNADYIRIVGGSVNIRSSASKDSKSKGTIPNGGVADCLGTAQTDSRGVKWYKVEYNGVTGWVSSQYAQPTNDASSSEGGSSTATRVRIVGGDCSIRAKADKESTRLGVIKSGKTAEYLGKSSKDSRGVVWYKIKYDGVTGWVSSRYADLYD